MADPGPPAPGGPHPRPQSGAAQSAWLGVALALALGGFAYRTLWGWDPATHELPALEGWIFLASERPPLVVIGLAVVMLVVRYRAILAALGSPPAPLAGLLAVAAGVGLLAGGRWHTAPELALISGVPLGIGLGLLVGGWTLARQLAFPFALLLLALPLPAALYHPLVHALQGSTAIYATKALALLGLPAVRDAELITLPGASFMVIETCSGVGSVTTLTLLAIFWAGLRRARPLHGMLLVAGAPVIAFGLNGLRVVALILTPGSEAAGFHALQGLLLFLFGVLGLWLWDRGLERLQPALPLPPRTPPPAGAAHRAAWVAVACLAAASIASAAVPVRPLAPQGAPWSMALPAELLGQPGVYEPVDNRHLGSLRFAWSQHMGYGERGRHVQVFIAAEDPADPRDFVVSPKNRVLGRGYEIESSSFRLFGPDQLPGEEVVSTYEARRVLSWVFYAGVASRTREAVAGALSLRPPALGTSSAGRVMRISTDLESSSGARQRAEERLEAALRVLAAGFAS